MIIGIFFFKKLSFSLENYFKILIINKNCFKKYDTEDSKKKIMNKKNYQMIINTFAMDAEDNDDYVCSLDNKSIIFAAPQSCIDEDTIKKLQTDFNNGFHKIIKLRKKEAFSDINNNTNLMANSIRYFVSIIFTIFGELEQATKLLNEIDLSTLPPSNKLVHYLNKNIICRYINIEFIYSLRIINKQEYLYNKQELMELEEHLSKLEVLIKSNSIYQNFLLDFYDMKAKVLFAKQDYYNALGLLNIINRKSPGNYITLLSIAFMHINMNNYIDGIKYYKRVSNRKDIDIHKINECISFIKNSLKSEDSNKILLNICLGIITFYWKNRYEGKVILQKTLKTVENEEMKKYIETRYIR